jgi:hypothetical protein
MGLIHTLHVIKDNFFNLDNNMVLIVHCSNRGTRTAIQQHHHTPHSPGLCLSPDWDKLHDLRVITSRFKQMIVQDPTNQMIVAHHQLLSQIQTICSRNEYTIHTQSVLTQSQLIIHDNLVANKHIKAIRSHSREEDVTEYLCIKNGWCPNIFQSITWKPHGSALIQLPSRQRKTVTQFLHGWLPLNTSHHLQLSGSARMCPLRATQEEICHHMLSRTHLPLQELWLTASKSIQQKLFKYRLQVDQQVVKLIYTAVMEWRVTTQPPSPSFLEPKYAQLFWSQSTIGWDQILKGRFSSQCMTSISSDTIFASRWIAYTIRTI